MAEHRKMNNNDRRVKRTKKALHEALLTLLNEKSINEITVTELTTLADVNRATFYFYYTDLIDMLQQIQNEAYEDFTEVIQKATIHVSSIEGFTEYAERVFTYCKENEPLVRFIVNNDVNNRLYTYIRQLMLTNIPNTKEIFGENNPAKFISNYVINAMIGVCIDWMDDGMKIPARDLAELCANVYINGSFKTKQLYATYEH
ncbi:MAG: TetR-like C-terminal domain-containing protein [Acutalibacteraceae bacterium]|nr:TetR-like C-terminal domain-containing protein [Acutalibacteraceae bacterium]